jgi:glycosyltransferase involved in cell wall biosynthesis
MWRHYGWARQRQSLLSSYRALLVASRHMMEEYRRQGVRSDRLHLAPYFTPGTGPDAQPPAERLFSDRVLFLGRLTEIKGGKLIITALAQAAKRLARPLTLEVAGDGPDRPALETMTKSLGLPAIFHGWVDTARREELMRHCDVLAVPSLWPEPFGLVGLEAGCVGLPSVGFAVGGIPEWLVSGETGELAPGDPPTVEGLADALVRALADPIHLARLRRGAWEMSRRFTLTKHLDVLESVLAQAADGRRE